jgi:acetoin:2,6-dichlorophenolindophenol oxidoreductase subunit beta
MKVNYSQAMARALEESLRADPKVFMIGSTFAGLSAPGRAAFAPVLQEYASRIIAAPVSELGLAGTAIGAALSGCRPLVDLGAGSFTYQAWAQIANEAPNMHYMSGGQTRVPVTFYCLIGIRGGGAAQHSHRIQAMLGNVPGLQLLLPGTPADAYGMLKWALQESSGPTVFLSHSQLLEDEEEVDFAAPALPVGKARISRAGRDLTIVAHSVMVSRSLAAADLLARDHGVEAEVIDMRSLCPLDRETLVRSVAKTGRAVVADECHFSFGAGAELAATLAQEAFGHLKAPVLRVATPDAPIPFSPVLESAMVVTPEKIAAGALAILEYRKA